jgi:uncharacterized membrane protein
MTTEPDRKAWWQTRGGIALVGFMAIAGFFLLTEHTAHVLGVLPYVLVLACPLLHFFMHSKHHKGEASADHHQHANQKRNSTDSGKS